MIELIYEENLKYLLRAIILAILLGTSPKMNLMAQYSIPNELIDMCALIQTSSGRSGSGFFLQDSVDFYFVTARHILFDEIIDQRTKNKIYNLRELKVEINWYPRDAISTDANTMIVDIKSLMINNNLIVGNTENADYVVLRIGQLKNEGNYYSVNYSKYITRTGPSSSIKGYLFEWIGASNESILGDEVFIVGYPKSLGLKEIPQYDFNRPLIRKGIIAGKDIKRNSIVIDCPSYGGNSGGPVLEVVGNVIENQFKLVGLVSSFIPLEEVWINPNYGIKNVEIANSGYSVVVPLEEVKKSALKIKNERFE